MEHRRIRGGRALAGALGGMLAVVALGGQGARAAGPAPSTVPLAGQVVPGLAQDTDLGPVAPDLPVEATVTVTHDLAALYRAEAALYDPASPQYHHFLTPDQYEHVHGTPPAQTAAVRSFATSGGMKLGNPSVLNDMVVVSGTAAQADLTFGVDLHNFRDATGRTFYASRTAASVPAGLGIDAVLGLESYHQLTLGPTATAAAAGGQPQCDPSGSVCTGILQPQDLWAAYDQPADNQGQGQTMGIIGEGQTADVIAALREFEKTRNLPTVPVQVYHVDPTDNGAESKRDDSGRIEWELDTQASTGMAPQVSQVRLYFGSSLLLTQLSLALQTWANDPAGPLQASASLGACEDTPATDLLFGAAQRASQAALIQAASEGRTFFASTGDTGAGCSVAVSENGIQYGPIPVTEYPSVDPNTVAVGGTILYTDGHGNRVLERAWDHTGGGPSRFIAQPAYQAGASPLLAANACIPNSDSGTAIAPGSLCRGVSDVAALSGDITISADHKAPGTISPNGYDMVDNNGGTLNDHFSEGGTSLSSPLWLGMWTRVQAHHDIGNAPKTSLGQANPLIYKLAQAAATAHDFNDITAGGNPYPAAPGWDFPTGWGSPDVSNLVKDASGNGTTAALSTSGPSGPDPAPILASAVSTGPSCSTLFYDSSSDAPDGFNTQQDDQLDIVEGDFGLTPDGKDLRAVLTIKNLSKTIPTGSNYLDFEMYWNFTPAGATSPTTYAVDTNVDSSGNVTYTDGTMTVTTAGGTTNYQFVPNPSSTATGSFGSGPGGRVEVDAPLAEIGSPAQGTVLSAASAYTADGLNPPSNPVAGGVGFIADQDGPGADWTVGAPTCLTQPAASVPDAPSNALLLVSAGVAVLSTVAVRRRRVATVH